MGWAQSWMGWDGMGSVVDALLYTSPKASPLPPSTPPPIVWQYRALISSLQPDNEQGQAFAMIAVLESLPGLWASPLASLAFSCFLHRPGLVLLGCAALPVCTLLTLCLGISHGRLSRAQDPSHRSSLLGSQSLVNQSLVNQSLSPAVHGCHAVEHCASMSERLIDDPGPYVERSEPVGRDQNLPVVPPAPPTPRHVGSEGTGPTT